MLMKALDSNNDGQVDSSEWDKGVQSIQKQMEQEKMKLELSKPKVEEPPLLPIVQKTPEGLMVFASSEEDVVKKLGLAAFFQTVFGPLMVTAGVYILLAAFR